MTATPCPADDDDDDGDDDGDDDDDDDGCPGTPTKTPTKTPTPTTTATPTATATVTATPGPCVATVLDFAGLPAGTILAEQFASLRIHISANAFGSAPDALILLDSNATGPRDQDLRVGIGNVDIIPTDLADISPVDGLVDVPNDSAAGGQQIYEFDQDRFVSSFTIVDIDHSGNHKAEAFDAANNLLASVTIPDVGDASVQTIVMNVGGVRKLVITYADSGAVTEIVLNCDSTPPCPTSCI